MEVYSLPDHSQAWASPSVSDFAAALDGAKAAIVSQKERGIIPGAKVHGAFVEISGVEHLVIVSDLHGDYECLHRVLGAIDFESYLSDELNKIVFLGDYVDRGPNAIGVLNSVCQMKRDHPSSVILMRGNHEAPSEFPFSSHDYPFQLVDRYGESAGRAVYLKSLALFKELSVAAVVSQRLLLVHGGLPTDEKMPSDYRDLLSFAHKDHVRTRTLEELLWNDPREVNGWEKSRRGIGRHFGEQVTQEWLEASGTKCIVRGHEPCQGFRIDHDGRILTLFSCHEPYPKFKAAYISIDRGNLDRVRSANDLVPFVKFPELI
jgi:protein phosphatase